jgi:hypothetical protein
MTQNAPEPNAGPLPARPRPASARVAAALAGTVSAAALLLPLVPQSAMAQGWQITTHGTPGSRSTTIMRVRPGSTVTALKDGPAPPNNCRISAFEVVNPRRGEARCVGAVSPYWWP